MITFLTGTPGAGKTCWVIDHLLTEIKKGRKIYVDNIPDLVLDVKKAGRIDLWHEGTWLGIDTYDPLDLDDPDFDPDSCWKENGNEKPDAGCLIVVDECQRWFRPRGGRTVPPHIAAMEVHRHQGIDFLFITQNLSLVDANLKALCSKHIHIRLTPFGRKIYEWPEVANPNSKQQRESAAKSSYKPNSSVFNLYKSASVHTKLKHKLPNAAIMIGLAGTGFLILGYFVYTSTFKQLFSDDVIAEVEASAPLDPSQILAIEHNSLAPEKRNDLRKSESEMDRLLASSVPVSGCFAYVKNDNFICKCSGLDGRIVDDLEVCVSYLDLTVDQVEKSLSSYKKNVRPVHVNGTGDRFWIFRKKEFKRLHPYRDFRKSDIFLSGLEKGYYTQDGDFRQ